MGNNPDHNRKCECPEPAGETGQERMSAEAFEHLRKAAVSPDFLNAIRSITRGVPTEIIRGPAEPIEPPFPELPAKAFYLRDLTLDFTGVSHMTPGLWALEGANLGEIVFQQAPGGGLVMQQEGGGTVVRDPAPEEPKDDDTLFPQEPDSPCNPGVIARVALVGGGKAVETHNLRHGFEEIVVPFGYDARIDFRPDADQTFPYTGTLVGVWEADTGFKFTGRSSGGRAALRKWQDETGDRSFKLSKDQQRPFSSQHTITVTWTPDGGQPCSRSKTFTVTFAQEIAEPPRLDLGGFYVQRGGFNNGIDKRGGSTFVGGMGSRDGYVLVPVVVYWRGNNCCNILAKPEVIQFARAIITGPNGHQGKDWTLDISSRARSGRPDHDPTFTNQPGSDQNESPTAPGAGSGTRREPGGLGQWDAPGMPKSLYDRLCAAQNASNFRQQFLALLVCRPPGRHGAKAYLKSAKIRSILVMTVVWDFPGRGAPPTVRIVANPPRNVACVDLRAFLTVNGLLKPFENPTEDARALKLLDKTGHDRTRDDVDKWQSNPDGAVRLP